MEPLIGQIILFGGNFAPRGWAFCDGQSLKIAENEGLFAILGTTYGGDGRNNFCLPDMRGRVPMHSGQGTDLSPRDIGQELGSESVALSASQLPEHRHEMLVSDAQPDGNGPSNGAVAAANIYVSSENGTHRQRSAPKTPLNSKTIGLAGGSAPHENMQPTLCLNYIIAIQGMFPSRN
jgi:microcystin-dependent protein